MQFVKYDAPVSKMSLDITCIFMYMIQGHIKGEIADLGFENCKNVRNVFSVHSTSWDKYMFDRIPKLKLGLSLFGKIYCAKCTLCNVHC